LASAILLLSDWNFSFMFFTLDAGKFTLVNL
jgi:hypothetical protein